HLRVIMFEVKDLSDWVAAGRTREQLYALIEQAPEQAKQKEEDDEDPVDVEAEIERLMALSDLEYEQQKRDAAKKLGVGVSYLDRLRKAEHAKGDDGKQGHAISFPEPEAWPELVEDAALLDAIAAAIRQHVVLADHCRDAAALWVLHTYAIDRFLVS